MQSDDLIPFGDDYLTEEGAEDMAAQIRAFLEQTDVCVVEPCENVSDPAYAYEVTLPGGETAIAKVCERCHREVLGSPTREYSIGGVFRGAS